MKRCFAVVMDKKVKLGYRALMNSLLRHTTDFSESVVCLSIDLDTNDQQDIQEIYDDVQFIDVTHKNYKKLPTHAPALRKAFYKLDLFKLAREYERITYVDTDIIFLKSIRPLLDAHINEEIGVCYHKKQRGIQHRGNALSEIVQ